MFGVHVNVHQVPSNIPYKLSVHVVHVQVVGILYGVWYSHVCVVDNFILGQ